MERAKIIFAPLLTLFTATQTIGQDTTLLAHDEFRMMGDEAEADVLVLNEFDRYNPILGIDSVRHCGEFPCIGWVEDRYPDGTLKHRGFYDRGRTTLYKNYHPNGELEREFRSIDARKSILRTYHSNAASRSETRYFDGVAIEYKDYYNNGQLRYHEEKHRQDPYYLRMDLYAANGDPISLMKLVDKKKIEFELQEFHPGGKLHTIGRARYHPGKMDSQRIGTWRTYSAEGVLLKEVDHIDGKVHAVR